VEPVVTPILIPDGTDGNSFRPKGAKTYGIFPGIVSQEIVSQMHGDTERVPLASVHEAAANPLRDAARYAVRLGK
jgi:acetylornithine deacetylase/succinyl-diaminopimelate desuccinylase-like protein